MSALPQRIAITGASGLIGSALVGYLKSEGHTVQRLVRRLPVSADEIQWVPPSEDKPITVICHDESTFSSGDQQSHKWSFGFNSAFYDKNRGRSRMLSYFLCQHPYVSLFELSDEEMSEALKKYPELREQDIDFARDSNSSNASMEPGKNKDGYFDNMTVLKQFERLFKMLEFKTVFKNTDKVLFIDNARDVNVVK